MNQGFVSYKVNSFASHINGSMTQGRVIIILHHSQSYFLLTYQNYIHMSILTMFFLYERRMFR